MNGYSKMRVRTNKSRSMDLCNLNFSPPQVQDDQEGSKAPTKLRDEKMMAHDGRGGGGGEYSPHGHHQGERFGVMLSRNGSSSSSSAPQRFRSIRSNNNNDEKKSNPSASAKTTTLQAAVRRAFSMRKSNSIGDGYWRIHDTADANGADQVIQEEEADEEDPTTTTSRRTKKRGNIFRACKRFFKF